jgi:hypothetical protein
MPTVPSFAPSTVFKAAVQNFRPIEVFLVLHRDTSFSGKNGFLKGATPTVNQAAVLLCTLESMPTISVNAVGEETISMPGKSDYLTAPDSVGFETTITLNGSAMGTLMYMMGINPSTGTAIDWSTFNFGMVGSIIINKYDRESKAPVTSLLLANCKMKIPTVAGVPESGNISQEVMFYNETAKVASVNGTKQWTYSLYHDNGASVTNAAAPDGTLTAFILDDCNNSATTTPPQPLLVFPNKTGYEQYLAVLRLDATIPTTQEATFATATITFTTAPADGKSILAIYAIDTALYDAPMYHKGTGGMLNLSEVFMGVLPS